MKIVVTITLGLLILSLGYIYMHQQPKKDLVVTMPDSEPLLTDTQCTSTTCMKKNTETVSDITGFENSISLETEEGNQTPAVTKIIGGDETEKTQQINSQNKQNQAGIPFTEFVNPSGFINTEPFMMADYIGKKIILIEFITYSCINCKRTFPYMQAWHETYKDEGLLVIGIHTPEFAYERDRNNVIAAMNKEGVTFPLVQDNEYQTWNAYNNRFWPHRYIIDYTGNVVFDHIGEGAYYETEAVIKHLLANKPIGA